MPNTFTTLDQLGVRAGLVIADHLNDMFRAVLSDDDSLLTDDCFRYVTREPHPLGNLALFSRTATRETILAETQPLLSPGFPSAVCFLDDGTKPQRAAVESIGFVHAESMPCMSVTPETLEPTELPPGHTFDEIGLDEAEAWAIGVSDGYGLPRAIGHRFGKERTAARRPEGTARHYAVKHEGQIVATSLLYLHDGLAGIYGVATLPEHRGKGLGAHATAEPLRWAWGQGYRTGVLQASEMGAPVYTRIGFVQHGHMALFARIPKA